MQARVSRCMHIHGISRKLASRLPFKNPTFSRKVQVILPLSFCHMLKRPKDIESDMLSSGLVFLFRALEIQMTHCNGQWKTKDSSRNTVPLRYNVALARDIFLDSRSHHARLVSSVQACYQKVALRFVYN